MSFETVMFKFATYGIIICAFFMFQVELNTISDASAVTSNTASNILLKAFFSTKSICNMILIIVCGSCRTRFDLTEIPEIFERFLVTHVFLTIFAFVVKVYFFDDLTTPYKEIINYELLFTIVSVGLSAVAFMTWTPYKSTHISKTSPYGKRY